MTLGSCRWRWLVVLWALAFGAAAVVSPPSAVAQPAPSGSAKAQPPKTKPDAGPPTKDQDGGSDPATDGGLPPGHPPTQNQGQQRQQADAHGQFFQPPEDVVETAPDLPPGTLVFSLRDSDDRPVQAPVTLSILHNTVARGESSNEIKRDTNEEGQARYDGLEVGQSVSYTIAATRGPGRFETPKLQLDDKAGKRVTLHVYESTRSHDDLRVGTWGWVHVGLREDAIVIEQHMTVLNVERVAWVPEGFMMTLPEGFKAFTVPDGMEIRFKEVAGRGAELQGTITPGQHETMFRYHVPLEGAERQSLSIKMPPKVFQFGIMVEVAKNMAMEAPGFPPPQRSEQRGKRVLVTKKQVSGPGDELSSIEIKLSGLPTRGPARWIAVLIAAATVAFAFFWVKRRQDEGGADPETMKDLYDAREALIQEILDLERARKAGEIGPKSYARIRAGLLDALARIVDRHEQERAPHKRRAAAA